MNRNANLWVKILSLTVLWISSHALNAQDVVFSQLSQTQLITNPAFAGIMYGPRLVAQYRNQYPRIGTDINSGYNTYYIGYDQFIRAANSGLAIQFMGDKMGNNIYSRYRIEAAYTYQIKFDDYRALRLGVSGNYNIRQFDYTQLQFFDQIDPVNGFSTGIATREDIGSNYNSSFFNAGFGALYFTNDYYFGVSARNLLKIDNLYTNSDSRFQNTILSAQAGAVLKWGFDKQYGFFPIAQYDRQNGYQKITANLIGQYKIYNLGTGFRYNFDQLESVFLMAGFNLKHLRISYSYDIATNALVGYSGGSHEIGIRLLLGGEDNSLTPNEEKDISRCPDFLKN